jgi:hypothetical protein
MHGVVTPLLRFPPLIPANGSGIKSVVVERHPAGSVFSLLYYYTFTLYLLYSIQDGYSNAS